MAKDHSPGGFNRSVDYRSDLEIAETQPNIKSINTSFGSKNHNAYVMLKEGNHEHFFYAPATQKSGWHGANYPTKNNHPKNLAVQNSSAKKGEQSSMSNAFLDSLKADQATIDKCNEVSKNWAKNHENQQTKSAQPKDTGGRERGEGRFGRESGYKTGEVNASPTKSGQNSNSQGDSTGGQSPSGHSSAGHSPSSGGHTGSSGGHSGSGSGHGGSGDGHGGSGGGHGGH